MLHASETSVPIRSPDSTVAVETFRPSIVSITDVGSSAPFISAGRSAIVVPLGRRNTSPSD